MSSCEKSETSPPLPLSGVRARGSEVFAPTTQLMTAPADASPDINKPTTLDLQSFYWKARASIETECCKQYYTTNGTYYANIVIP